MLAMRVQSGDLVEVEGQWQEVKAVRTQRYATGGTCVTFVFQTGPVLRFRAGDSVAIRRDGQEVS
ncbi:hypothetical protein CUT44_16635 [Streptomyces carminius]|uniref:Uncharacterized protein n=1 Tax=Streptomyces carminius TaxID=2665496 RepID=A0A2M8LXH6_9ACTN|nr:hypothetical protein [Streptomyces carminius]PJE96668.1 hypothetical protein CUT44_16635 [Streptomyces carminius]